MNTKTPTDSKNIIQVLNLNKRYDDVIAVDNISFTVREGEVFGLLGPNGAGKTTTVEILEGMKEADSGNAIINGLDVSKDPAKVKAGIGVQLQGSAFFDYLTVTEIVRLYGEFYGLKINPETILNRIQLMDRRNAYFKQLSGGQKQRLSIAVALVHKPKVLFLDEPTTSLDPQARRQVWDIITEIRSAGNTIVLTTHYMEEAEELCDRVAIMDHGKIVAIDSPDKLIQNLLDTGFKASREARLATLEDVFINLTGRSLRES